MDKTTYRTANEGSKKVYINKKIMIFDIIFSFITNEPILQTQFLHRKLELLMKEKGMNIDIETYSSNKIDQYGGQADLILLTPVFGHAKEEFEKKFPETPVIAISKQDYGLLNMESLYNGIIDLLK
ncbi:hypothetical protein A5844_001898 [Enterococcus sp. 10A9_DIV0425]|uniref:PTS EIIB type-3 domain-containing protein n=1 Tax=Candidatus Enterococcus wittei TaxID=1987383 RepID=A0A242JYA5_9ENTE|nr:hypothetical protein [Enterococcus sp. 10A9_DIV0425]OTP10200.1 hypothetical protein A5844_001898 [Enterococcus sp. 10A9_DIV0425]